MAASLEDAPVLSAIACLELKQNAGTARSKVRLQASPDVAAAADRAAAASAIPPSRRWSRCRRCATLEKELALPTMAPRLTTWYRRASMTAESGRLRITLDERLTFCRAAASSASIGAEVAPSPADVIAPGPARILEIKHWGDRPGLARPGAGRASNRPAASRSSGWAWRP